MLEDHAIIHEDDKNEQNKTNASKDIYERFTLSMKTELSNLKLEPQMLKEYLLIPQLRQFLVDSTNAQTMDGYFFRRNPDWICVIRKNIHLVDDRSITIDYLYALLSIIKNIGAADAENKDLIKNLYEYAMKEFEINDSQTNCRISYYVKHSWPVGLAFPFVLPFLLKCMKYAKSNNDKNLVNDVYKSLDWGTGWYLSETENSSEKEQKNEPLTYEILKDILESTKDIDRALMYKIAFRLKPTKKKFDLIENKHIVFVEKKERTYNNNCTSTNKHKLNKYKHKLYMRDAKSHMNKTCTCYCSCDNCWHNLCNEIV
jgi:hypothetical protein